MGTIYTVDKMWSRTASDASTSEGGQRFDISFQEAYQVTCSPDTTVLEIYQAPGIPAANSLYPGTHSVYCVSAAPQRVTPVYWIVPVSWAGEFGPAGPEDSPLNTAPKISWTDVETDEAIDVDYNGSPIVTVNNEPIEGVTKKIADQVVTIQRNFASFSPSATAAYRDSVSSDVFLGFPAGTARLVRFSANLVTGDGPSYWDVTAGIQFRYPYNTTPRKAWWSRVRHEGYYEKRGGLIVRALDEDNEPTVKPVLLKEDGTRETDPEAAHWIEIQKYGELPYNALGLV